MTETQISISGSTKRCTLTVRVGEQAANITGPLMDLREVLKRALVLVDETIAEVEAVKTND